MTGVTQPVMTTPSAETVVFNNHLNNADLSYAFGGRQDLQVPVMTSQEMDETQGAIAPWVAGAGLEAVAGGAGYIYGWARGNYSWNNVKFVGNVATGAVIGGTFGAAGAAAR